MTAHRTAADRAIAVAEGRALATSGAGRMIRQAAGLSLADVGRALNVDPAAVWHWETGSKRPSGENAAEYRDFLEQLRKVHVVPGRRRVSA